jgi:hypothetical protein
MHLKKPSVTEFHTLRNFTFFPKIVVWIKIKAEKNQKQPYNPHPRQVLHRMICFPLKSGEKKFSIFLTREIFEKNESRILKKVNGLFCSKFDADSENS